MAWMGLGSYLPYDLQRQVVTSLGPALRLIILLQYVRFLVR